jgi:hypothetical protein
VRSIESVEPLRIMRPSEGAFTHPLRPRDTDLPDLILNTDCDAERVPMQARLP